MLAIADLARKVIQAGREVSGRKDIRCTVSIGGFVPKPHTPFQWAAQCQHEVVDSRLRQLGAALRADKTYGRAIGFRYHDGKPSVVEGLLSRGDRRVGKVIEAAWRDGARFDGWSEHFSYDRWLALRRPGAGGRAGRRRLVHHPRAGPATRCCPGTTWTRGWTSEWLWQDWQDALNDEVEVEDCRWSACYDCGVCPSMGTEIQTGPTGERLPLAPSCSRC